MNDQNLQFKVGLFVITALTTTAVMVFQFGDIRSLWEPTYPLVVHFHTAPGVSAGTPVRRNGISIGRVEEVVFDDQHGGVLVIVQIRSDINIRTDSRPRLMRSLLGDSNIDFLPGVLPDFLSPGDRITGDSPPDPVEIVVRLESQVGTSLESMKETSAEWQRVAENINSLLETNRGNLDLAIQRSAESLQEFTLTMQTTRDTLDEANRVFGNPENQENLRQTLAMLPKMAAETRQTIAAVRSAVSSADQNLRNLEHVTKPLSQHTASIVTRLDNAMAHFESVSEDINVITQLAVKEDGSMQRFLADPELYINLNRSASSLAVLMENLEPIMQDVRIFADKAARHPETLGLGGVFNPSSGIKLGPTGTAASMWRSMNGN